jgi:hypothetical protein
MCCVKEDDIYSKREEKKLLIKIPCGRQNRNLVIRLASKSSRLMTCGGPGARRLGPVKKRVRNSFLHSFQWANAVSVSPWRYRSSAIFMCLNDMVSKNHHPLFLNVFTYAFNINMTSNVSAQISMARVAGFSIISGNFKNNLCKLSQLTTKIPKEIKNSLASG